MVDLVPRDDGENEPDRLQGSYQLYQLLDVEVPQVKLPVAPGRNLAVLVEAAARNQILRYGGYDAAEDFMRRQRAELQEQQ
jgi:HPr kinase/phosphorylase